MCEPSRNGLERSVLLLVAVGQLCFLAGSAAAAEPKRPELILSLGHTDWVTSVALSGDGKRTLTGSRDGTAILWEVESGKPLQTFKGHGHWVWSVALSGDGRRVLTGSYDTTAILWDVETGKPLQTFKGHTSAVWSVALSGNGKHVLTGSWDQTAILWEVETGKPLQTFKGHTSDVWSVALSGDGKRVLTGSGDKTAILWEAASGKPLQTFTGHTDKVTSVALSGDGQRVLTGSGDGTAILWEVESGKPLQTFKGHTNYVTSVALSGDSQRVLTGSVNQTAILWEVESGKSLQTFKGHTNYVTSVALSGDGKRVLTGSWDRTAILWEVETGKPLQTLKGHTDGVYSVALSGDGQRVLTGSDDKTAILWEAASGKPLQTFTGHTNGVYSVALSGDGQRVLTGSWDKTAILWEVESGKPLQTFKGHTSGVTSVALSRDGKHVLTGSDDKTAILWEVESGKPLQTFKGHTSAVFSVALSGDGQRVLTGSFDQTAILWEVESSKPLQTFRGHTDWVLSVVLSGDGKRVLTGSRDQTAILWEVESGKPLQTFKGHTVSSVALSGDGKRVLTGSGGQTAILWEVETGKPLQTFKWHKGFITSVAFASRDAFVATASTDGTVRLWKPGRDEPVFSFLAAGDDWLFWTSEGYYTCSPNGENLIAWKIYDDSPLGYHIVGPEQFHKQFYRPDLFRHLLRELDLTKALAAADKESGRTVEAPSNLTKALPPVVLITKPERDGEIDTEKLTIEAVAVSVGEQPVTRLRLLLDGRPYLGNLSTYDIPEPRLGKVKWSKEVDLEPGAHTIQVIAESAVSEGRSDLLRIRRKAQVETLPRLFVLAIGVSAYEKETLRKGVYYSAADARKIADTIETASKPLYREIQVVRLLDQDATRKKILQAFTQMRKQATQRDAVLIFFAGHGKRDDQNNFYFLPVEADLDDLASTGLSEGDFKAAVKALPGRVILLLDACHSGTLIENSRSVDGPTDKLYRDLTSNEYGLVLLCSSKGMELSSESNEHKSGLFTLAVVEGLQGKASKSSEGAVYLKALDAYVTERVKTLSEGRQHPLSSVARTISDIALTRP